MSPAKICSTCRTVRPATGLLVFTTMAMPSWATMVGFMFTPLAWAADISVADARRELMPICAVPSVMAVMPVVEPSAAISNETPGWAVL